MWSYKKPEQSGMYYINRGDVVTQDTLKMDYFGPGDSGVLEDSSGTPVMLYHTDYKFLRVNLDYLNSLGNE